MYLEHFGLRTLPFTLTPDTRFFLGTASHRDALNLLWVALRSGEGFSKVVGEVGTGKTLLCRKLLGQLEGRAATAYLPSPLIGPASLARAVAEEFGVALEPGDDAHRVWKRLERFLAETAGSGRRAVLLVDEAQALPTGSLEAVRMLSNFETETRKLLQVVLFGQPELDARLAQPQLRQVRQRITFSHRLQPLTRDETDHYLVYRVRVAGQRGPRLFSAPAVDALHHASGGVPRLLNVLAHKTLLVAWGLGERRIVPGHVLRAARDTEGARCDGLAPRGSGWLARMARAAGLGGAASAGRA